MQDELKKIREALCTALQWIPDLNPDRAKIVHSITLLDRLIAESGKSDREKQGGFVIGDVVEYIGQYKNNDGWKGHTFIVCEVRNKKWGVEYTIQEWDRWDGLCDGLLSTDLRLVKSAAPEVEG